MFRHKGLFFLSRGERARVVIYQNCHLFTGIFNTHAVPVFYRKKTAHSD
jgi:hypothetical protein